MDVGLKKIEKKLEKQIEKGWDQVSNYNFHWSQPLKTAKI